MTEAEEAFERWLKYEREACLANTQSLTFQPLPCPDGVKTVTFPREHVLHWRASYMLLLNACAELLGLDPQEMTQLDMITAIAKLRWAQVEEEKAIAAEEARGG